MMRVRTPGVQCVFSYSFVVVNPGHHHWFALECYCIINLNMPHLIASFVCNGVCRSHHRGGVTWQVWRLGGATESKKNARCNPDVRRLKGTLIADASHGRRQRRHLWSEVCFDTPLAVTKPQSRSREHGSVPTSGYSTCTHTHTLRRKIGNFPKRRGEFANSRDNAFRRMTRNHERPHMGQRHNRNRTRKLPGKALWKSTKSPTANHTNEYNPLKMVNSHSKLLCSWRSSVKMLSSAPNKNSN